jgi:hypothetical protein
MSVKQQHLLVGSKSFFLICNSVADPDLLESASFWEARSGSAHQIENLIRIRIKVKQDLNPLNVMRICNTAYKTWDSSP